MNLIASHIQLAERRFISLGEIMRILSISFKVVAPLAIRISSILTILTMVFSPSAEMWGIYGTGGSLFKLTDPL
jgi:hypothetical protein